jgi:hypothetical protein
MESLYHLTEYLTAHSGEYILALGIIAVLAVWLALQAAFGLRSVSRPLQRLLRSSNRPEEVLPILVKNIEENMESVKHLSNAVKAFSEEGKRFFKHVGLVRYDAFEDIGGQQSYSLCLLDSSKNGFLITYLTGKSFTRSYAVSIRAGEHSRKLGDEELKAYEEAIASMR